jgi:HlyD family secretion protein
VERQRGVVANYERRVDELTVRSPVDGIVGSIAVQQRAAVAPNQPLLTVVDLSVFEIELAVPESYADDLVLEEKPDALIVDRGAFLESGGGRVAYKVDDGVARRTSIATGATSIAKVEITQGLAEGDQIVISSLEPFGRAETALIRN